MAYIHLHDLLFYVDRSPYTGSCEFVHEKLEHVKMPKINEMPFYTSEDFLKFSKKTKPSLDASTAAIFDNYEPSLTPLEQQRMLYVMLAATQAMTAFNITYSLSEGSLIGYWRHHGMIPWDDDVDILVDAEKWPLARKIFACLPEVQMNMGSDYMWKLFHKDSTLWEGEDFLKFPFIDIFLFRNDSEHIWPLTIWAKTNILFPVKYFFPLAKGVFEGWPVVVPKLTGDVLSLEYGPKVMQDCYSRTFKRRERFLVPVVERTHFDCAILFEQFPFVFRHKKGNQMVEERRLGLKVISTFNTTLVSGVGV